MQQYLINRNSTKMKRLLRLTNFNLPSYFGLKSAKIIELFSQNAESLIFYRDLNPLMPGDNKKVTHTYTNLQLSAACLFKYV